MPAYSYKCNDCGKMSTVIQKMGQAPDKLECSHCGSVNLVRSIKSSGFHIAGEGVYRQGYSEYKAPHKPTSDGTIFTGKETDND